MQKRRSLASVLAALQRSTRAVPLVAPREQARLDVAFVQRRRTIVDAALRMGEDTAAAERRHAMALVRIADKPWPRVLPLFLRLPFPFAQQRSAGGGDAGADDAPSVPDTVAARLLPCNAKDLYREVLWAERLTDLVQTPTIGQRPKATPFRHLQPAERTVYRIGASRNREVRAAIQWLTAADPIELCGNKMHAARLQETAEAPALLRKVLQASTRESSWLLPAVIHQGVTPQEARSVVRSTYRKRQQGARRSR